jgi:hypothetical protein
MRVVLVVSNYSHFINVARRFFVYLRLSVSDPFQIGDSIAQSCARRLGFGRINFFGHDQSPGIEICIG